MNNGTGSGKTSQEAWVESPVLLKESALCSQTLAPGVHLPKWGIQTHGEGSDDPCNVQASPGRPGSARTSWGGGRAGSTSRRSRPERGAGSPDLRNLGPRAVEGREWLAAPSPLPRDPGRQGPAPGGHVVVPPLPPPRPPSPGAAAPTDPRSGEEEEGPRRRKPSRKRARRPRFPGEAAGGVAQPAGSRSRRHSRLHGVLKNLL